MLGKSGDGFFSLNKTEEREVVGGKGTIKFGAHTMACSHGQGGMAIIVHFLQKWPQHKQ